MIRDLLPSAVDYVGDLVSHHKLQVLLSDILINVKDGMGQTYLCSEFITNEQAILDLDGPYHVVVHHLLLLILSKLLLHSL